MTLIPNCLLVFVYGSGSTTFHSSNYSPATGSETRGSETRGSETKGSETKGSETMMQGSICSYSLYLTENLFKFRISLDLVKVQT